MNFSVSAYASVNAYGLNDFEKVFIEIQNIKEEHLEYNDFIAGRWNSEMTVLIGREKDELFAIAEEDKMLQEVSRMVISKWLI